MAQPDPPPSPDRFDARLRAAQERRGSHRDAGRRAQDDAGRTDRGRGIGLALRIGTELVAGLAVGVAIGLGLDWWLGTKPWLMIVFFFLGAAAGIVNVYRTMSGLGHAVGYADPGRAQTGDAGRDGSRPDEREGG